MRRKQRLLDRAIEAMNKESNQAGIPRPRVKLSEDELRELHKRYMEGATLDELVEDLNMTRPTLATRFREAGLYIRTTNRRK